MKPSQRQDAIGDRRLSSRNGLTKDEYSGFVALVVSFAIRERSRLALNEAPHELTERER